MNEDPKLPPAPSLGALGAVTTLTYDAGLVSSRAPGRPEVQTLTYETARFARARRAGRLATVPDPLGKVCTFVYDATLNIDPDRRSG